MSASTSTQTAANTLSGSYVTTRDGVSLYYKDWGPRDGQVVTFSHGWPLNSDSWESQMMFLASKGYRVVAHDRRGHGRSSQPWEGNDMDQYADDLAALAFDPQTSGSVATSTAPPKCARLLTSPPVRLPSALRRCCAPRRWRSRRR